MLKSFHGSWASKKDVFEGPSWAKDCSCLSPQLIPHKSTPQGRLRALGRLRQLSYWLRRFNPDELVSGWRDVAEKQLSILVSASFDFATSYFSLACL
jgi:hypothetical protein